MTAADYFSDWFRELVSCKKFICLALQTTEILVKGKKHSQAFKDSPSEKAKYAQFSFATKNIHAIEIQHTVSLFS